VSDQAGLCVVRMDAIGDFVLWLSCAEGIRAEYPDVPITLVTTMTNAALARALPYWDEVWAIDSRRLAHDPAYRWRTLRAIRRRGFSTVLQPTYSRVFMVGDSLVRATGAAERIGSVGDLSNMRPWQKRFADRWYTKLVPATSGDLMELLRNCEFLTGLTGSARPMHLARLPVLTELAGPLQIARSYFVVVPGAAWVGRQWPIENFARVIESMNTSTGWVAVLCGAVNERALCEALAAQVSASVINLAGGTSLPELCEVIRRAKLLISNETSAVHIAAAVETPSVCILGGGHFDRFMPYPETLEGERPNAVFKKMPCYGCNWQCTQPHAPGGPVPCITAVSVEDVLVAVDRVTTLKPSSLTPPSPRSAGSRDES
jgi:ADP-heptose:LPS heptosyltransferase